MKKTNILYWIFTGLFAAFMLMSGIQNLMVTPDWVSLMTNLGYPVYLIAFLGVAKFLGVIAILIPGYPRIKEWAYAGFFFDLVGATYSVIMTEGLQAPQAFMILPFGLMTLSYLYYHKRSRQREALQVHGRSAVAA